MWEGPYRITAIVGVGAYYLEDLDEMAAPPAMECPQLKEVLPVTIHTLKCKSKLCTLLKSS